MSITESMMLVGLKISRFSAVKHDPTVSSEVAREHKTDSRVGRYNKNLLAPGALKAVDAAATAMRAFHYAQTLPWLDDGARILPAANYLAYAQGMAPLRTAFETAATLFATDYPHHIADARVRLNGLFNERDYPAPGEVRAMFACEIIVTPMPAASDFRVSLANEEVERVRAQIEGRTKTALANATQDLWRRLYETVETMRDRIAAYAVAPDGTVEKTFRDSAVNNLKDLCALLPRLNVTGDAELTSMTDRLAATLVIDPERLRKDDGKRERAISDANAALAKMAGYLGDGIRLDVAA